MPRIEFDREAIISKFKHKPKPFFFAFGLRRAMKIGGGKKILWRIIEKLCLIREYQSRSFVTCRANLQSRIAFFPRKRATSWRLKLNEWGMNAKYAYFYFHSWFRLSVPVILQQKKKKKNVRHGAMTAICAVSGVFSYSP